MLILVDQDGVLADFEGGFRSAWELQGHPHPAIPLDQRKNFYIRDDYPETLHAAVESVYTTPGFFRDLKPISGAIDAVGQLLNCGHDVRICTSPLNKYQHCVPEKYEWIESHLGSDFVSRMIVSKDKTIVLGDVLIDDKPSITGSRAPSWRHIIFDQPYNQTAQGPRLTWATWRNVLDKY